MAELLHSYWRKGHLMKFRDHNTNQGQLKQKRPYNQKNQTVHVLLTFSKPMHARSRVSGKIVLLLSISESTESPLKHQIKWK